MCVSTPGQRVFYHHLSQAGGSRVCSWREPTKLQVQTRISKEDALSTYLQPELLTTLSHLLCLIPWFFMLPTPKQVSYRFVLQLGRADRSFSRLDQQLVEAPTSLSDSSPYSSITFLPSVGTEFTEYKCQSVFRSAVPLGC